ncbi:hypothetical protein [uncultured Megasphaera sp.]|uniref:XkdQ/YqbQ family protein n=1 Tax=uncultured Megasphaera sp. TaxID=165188 RepID=UPI0025FF7183|nr:hypothetical protein [uncultured Megasphaera sp.]
MLSIRYSDPPETDAEAKTRKDSNGPEPKDNFDITNYVQKITWSGDSEQAARKLDFTIAYNTPAKDKGFTSLDLKIGGFVYLFYMETEASDEIEIFQGRIFFRKRASEGYSFDFTCFDDMIYLAKSNIRAVISGTVPAAISQVCNEIGIPVGTIPDDLNASVNFIADDKSCTEAIRMILDYQQAADAAAGKNTYYLPICINGQVNIIKKGELIEGYTATADTNIIAAEHSESIENMVNRIKAVDDNGTVCQMFTNNDDVRHFGMIQKIYKMQPPKSDETVDNVKAAKAKLARQKDESSLKGTGYIQCITGYSIKVQEEQLNGTFYIKSDTHQFEGGIHTMNLSLEYVPDTPETPNIEQVEYAAPVFNSSSGRMKNKRGISNGSQSVDAGLSAGWEAWGGQTMDNGPEGCAEFAGKCGSYYSPFMADEANNGVVNCDTMVSDADNAGLLSYDTTDMQKGDILVYGDNQHVVIYDGQGGYYGNSTSRDVTVHSGDYSDIGMPVTKVIKASRG